MQEKQQIDVAIFRYSVIHEFVGGIKLEYGEKQNLLKEKCARKWVIPFSEKTSISESTILHWIKRYEDGGRKLESLYPKGRSDMGRQRSLAREICLELIQMRQEFPDETVPFIIKKMKDRDIVQQNEYLSLSSIYRFFHQNNLMRKTPMNQDRRKYEAQMPNDIWQSDVMHGPRLLIDGKNKKTYLIAFIDDHSRLIVHGCFYTSCNAASNIRNLGKQYQKFKILKIIINTYLGTNSNVKFG